MQHHSQTTPTLKNLSPSKYLPVLFDNEEDGRELYDDEWEKDLASGGLGSPDRSENELKIIFTLNCNNTYENIEKSGDTSQKDLAHSFIWSMALILSHTFITSTAIVLE